jgi:hypothetical protein
MTKQLSDTEINARIVPSSARWPDSPLVSWTKLRETVSALKAVLHDLDNGCREAEADSDLSAQGIQNRRTDLGRKALTQLSDFRPLRSAERAVKENIDHLEERMKKLPSAPTEFSDVMLEMEIRANVARQTSPFDFAMQNMSDARVLGALLNAPAFLSGLAAEHMNAIRDRARQALHPEQTESQKQLQAALQDARKGVDAAKRTILERCNLREDPDGQFRPIRSPLRKSAAQPA